MTRYVALHATCICTSGTAPALIASTDTGGTCFDMMRPAASIHDKDFTGPFGTCKVTKTPCKRDTPGTWLPPAPNTSFGGKPPLMESNVLICTVGGVIYIADPNWYKCSSETEISIWDPTNPISLLAGGVAFKVVGAARGLALGIGELVAAQGAREAVSIAAGSAAARGRAAIERAILSVPTTKSSVKSVVYVKAIEKAIRTNPASYGQAFDPASQNGKYPDSVGDVVKTVVKDRIKSAVKDEAKSRAKKRRDNDH